MDKPDGSTDAELLRAWSAERCQASFAALVEKYLGLVQGVALRRTGDASLASDIAQAVFTRLAAKASRIMAQPTLAPWLHHCAWCEATSAVRRKSRRQRHMNAYADHLRTAEQSDTDGTLQDALPHLDAALQALPLDDQRIVLMHYFEGRGLRDIAAVLGKTEAAVRKQGQRALEKMAKRLSRSGVRISGAALVAGLGAVLSHPASASAVAAISTGAVATGANLTLLDHVLTLMNTKAKTALITAACMSVPLAWQWQRASRLEQRLRDLSMAEAVPAQIDMGVVAEPVESGDRGGVGNAKRPLSLQDLRNLLSDRPSRRHMAALWRMAEGMPPEELRRLLLEAVRSVNRDWQNDEIAAVLLERLGQVDPQIVAALVKQLEGEQAVGAMSALLPELAAINPAAAVSLFKQMSTSDRATLPVDDLLKVLADVDVEAAKKIVALLDPQDQGKAWGILVSGLSSKDPAGAIAFLKSLADADLAGGLGDPEALGRIAAFNPAETAELLDRLPGNNRAGAKYARLAEVWAAANPWKALAWAKGIEFEAIRSQTLTALYSAWALRDRGKAFEALNQIQDAPFRSKVFGAMAGEVIRQDPQGAVDWARGLKGGERSYALGLLGSHVASSDPTLAVQYVNEAIAGGKAELGEPISDIGHAYALRDPAAASKWAMELSDWWIREPAVAGVASAWTASDPVAASEWIALLPMGDARNNAIYNLVQNLCGADPASAFNWASNVAGNDDKRLYLLKQATDAWANFAPKEARVAIESLSIPPAERDLLLARLRD